MSSTTPTARAWFAGGERLAYDPGSRLILDEGVSRESPGALEVFRRTRHPDGVPGDAPWLTFLPGFPEGSYGWAAVDTLVADLPDSNTLHVEFVGQGDSDKPARYPYGTMERADLVEAHWRDLGVRSTTVVAFDYSAIVLLELLRRQIGRRENWEAGPFIERAVIINGGLFADAHSHPWFTTPLLKSPLGPLGTWAAQRSRMVFDRLVDVLYSKEYRVSSPELAELYDAIGRREGMPFLSRAAGFVDEHRRHPGRWDLGAVLESLPEALPLVLVGSADDPFEHRQITAARERLAGRDAVDIRMVPGGHMALAEQPDAIAEIVREVWLESRGVNGAIPSECNASSDGGASGLI